MLDCLQLLQGITNKIKSLSNIKYFDVITKYYNFLCLFIRFAFVFETIKLKKSYLSSEMGTLRQIGIQRSQVKNINCSLTLCSLVQFVSLIWICIVTRQSLAIAIAIAIAMMFDTRVVKSDCKTCC